MLLNGSLGKTLVIPTPGQAQLFKPSNSSTSTSCSITTAKNRFHPRTTMLQRPALLNSTTTPALFPFLPLTFSLLCVFGRMWKTATPVLALHCPCNVGSPNRSCVSGAGTNSLLEIRLPTACVMYTSCTSPNLCPFSTKTQHFATICRSVTMTRAGTHSVSPSHLQRPCGVRWGALGLQGTEMRAQQSSSHRRITLLFSISTSGSPTIQHSLLSQMRHAVARGTLWAGRADGITSIHAVFILQIGLVRTITS